jgi:hypothetical protein
MRPRLTPKMHSSLIGTGGGKLITNAVADRGRYGMTDDGGGGRHGAPQQHRRRQGDGSSSRREDT